MKARDIKKIGVTGADGFLGKKLCDILESKKYEVIKYNTDNLNIREKCKISEDIDVLYHLAAFNKPYFSKLEPIETFKTNALGTLNLLEAAKIARVKKIIFTSSILVYKNLNKTEETDFASYNGIYPYGFEKLIGEEYIKIYSKLFGIDYLILRISGVYGPGMCKNPIFDLIKGFLNSKVKLYINKNSTYNFIYIDDVVNALVGAINWKNETINVCSKENKKIIDIYNFLSKKLKIRPDIEDNDFQISILGNNKKIKSKGWKENYNLEKGILKTYNYLKNNGIK